MDLPEQRQDLLADEAAHGVGVARVLAMADPDGLAVRDRFVVPERQKRADDAILAPGLDAGRATARHQAVEDRLDLVRSGMPGSAEALGGDRIALLPVLDDSDALPPRRRHRRPHHGTA